MLDHSSFTDALALYLVRNRCAASAPSKRGSRAEGFAFSSTYPCLCLTAERSDKATDTDGYKPPSHHPNPAELDAVISDKIAERKLVIEFISEDLLLKDY